jgi:hypothetical protein
VVVAPGSHGWALVSRPGLGPSGLFALVLVAAPAVGCSLLFDGSDFEGEPSQEQPRPDAGGGTEPDSGSVAPDAALPDGAVDAAPPVDAAGSYTLSVTNGQNACAFANWQVGSVVTGVPLTITQDQEALTARIEGLIGSFLEAVIGSRVFQGEVTGDAVELTLFGTNAFTVGACTYTVNGTVRATVDGDVVEGSLEYTPSTNGSPDCGVLDGCSSEQRFNGTRPPR